MPEPHTGEGYDFAGPRLGPPSREGSCPSLHSAAAGAFLPHSGFEAWTAITVDSLPKRGTQPILHPFGVAGSGLPRLELRALNVDDGVRRARSAPPAGLQTAFEVALAEQVFGVCPNSGRVRKIQEPSASMTRAEVANWGLAFGDIDSVMSRRRNTGAPPPVHSAASARLAATSMEAIDIDARAGRRHSPSQWMSASWDLLSGTSKQAEQRNFLEDRFLADRQASLIGRGGAGNASISRPFHHSRETVWQPRESSRARTCSARRSTPQLAMDALLVEAATAAGVAVRSQPRLRSQPRQFDDSPNVNVTAVASNAGRAPPQVPARGSFCGSSVGSCCAVVSPAGGSWSGAATTASGAASGTGSLEPSPIASPAMSDAEDETAMATEGEAAALVKVPLAVQRVMSSMSSGAESSSLAVKAAAVLEMKRRTFQKEGHAHRFAKPIVAQNVRRWQ